VEVESPPWDGWCPNSTRGGSVGILVEVWFLSNCTPFFLPDEADTPARNFQIWRKNRAGPPSGGTQLTIRNGVPLFGVKNTD